MSALRKAQGERGNPDASLRSGRDDRGGLRSGRDDSGAADLPIADCRLPIARVYERLLGAYGPQRWWPGESAFEVIVGAILTQSAAWGNVEKALANLKAAGALSPEGLRGLDEGEIARLIRPSGYFNAKARKLKAFVEMVHSRFGGERGWQVKPCPPGDELDRLLAMPMEELRALLLSTHGIGPETADSIVLYAAGQPSFVIDAYTRRMFSRIGIRPAPSIPQGERGYEAWRAIFMGALPADAAMFNEYHALIVAHGKAVCRKEPKCGECVLRDWAGGGACAGADGPGWPLIGVIYSD